MLYYKRLNYGLAGLLFGRSTRMKTPKAQRCHFEDLYPEWKMVDSFGLANASPPIVRQPLPVSDMVVSARRARGHGKLDHHCLIALPFHFQAIKSTKTKESCKQSIWSFMKVQPSVWAQHLSVAGPPPLACRAACGVRYHKVSRKAPLVGIKHTVRTLIPEIIVR